MVIRCKFCNTSHPRDKLKCPAWGKTCSLCKRKNHFAVVCNAQRRSFGPRKSVSGVNVETDSSEEEYIALLETKEEVGAVTSDQYTYRPSAPLMINRKLERFQLDSGATVNVLSKSTLEGCFRKPIKNLVKTNTTLVMYNGSEVKPIGKTRIQVINPKNQKKYSVEFMVVEENCKSILGAKASQLMNLLLVNKENIFTTESSVKDVPKFITKQHLIEEYPEVFQGQGILPGTLHLEIDESVSPVQLPTRKIPLAVKDQLKAELNRLVDANVIAPVDTPTPWISALVVTVKKNGDIRLCIDPKPLNRALKRNHYPTPTIDDILPDLAHARCFSVLDAKNGFWHVRLDEPSSYATTFGTPWGRFRWLRMPFGLSPAPEEFQRRVNDILLGLPGIKVIADDILVFGCGQTDEEAYQDHDKSLRLLMERCKEKGLKLNPDKIQLQLNEVSYMGHCLTANGLKIDPEKTKAIRDMPVPTDKLGVQRLLGMANYVQKFAPRLAEITTPLRDLIKKGNEFKWEEHVHGRALNEIRQILSEPPVLRFFDPNVVPVLQCDASMNGLGACLLQNNQPVAYASRSLTPTEVQYAQIEKEMLAIVFGMERFESYLYGRKVKVESDHKPLESILKKSLLSAPKRLQRMMLRLQKFELEVVYKKGPLMFMADTLSRATLNQPNTNGTGETEEVMIMHDNRSETEREIEQIDMLQDLAVSESTLVQIKEQTEADSHLQALVRIVKEGWPSTQAEVPPALRVYHPFRDELTVQNGVILKGERLIVPAGMRAEMKEKLHHNHSGIQATLRRAREICYWPGMNKDIEEVIAKCNICAQYRAANQKEPLMSSPVPTRPWESIATDLFELRGKDYLVTVDYYSNFIEVDRLYSKTSTEVIHKLKAHMARYGIPERVVSDNGPQYSSSEFQDFATKYEFEHVTSSPRYPQSNGKAESAVKTAKRLMEKALVAKRDPYLALLEHRNTPSDGMSTSPAQRLLGRRTRTTIPTSRQLLEPTWWHSAEQELQQAKTKQAYYYNRGSKQLPALEVGDAVRMMPEKGRKTWRKGKVKAIVSPRSYIVRTDSGGNYRRNRRHLRKTLAPDDAEADIELPMEEQDRADSQPPIACEGPVSQQPDDHATPIVTGRTSSRQKRRPAYLEDYVTES